jgi:DNA-binding response OmpR family regulator
VALLLGQVLLEAGAEVVGPAASVGEALRLAGAAMAEGGGIGAAVLDLGLRGGTAIPVADLLAGRGVPFLFVTGHPEGRVTGRHGPVPVLHKPFEPGRLVAAIEALAATATAR